MQVKKKKFFFDQGIKGGSAKTIPEFTEPANTPFYTENQKKIYQQKQESFESKAAKAAFPVVPTGPSSYPPLVEQVAPNIPTVVPGPGKDDKPILDLQLYQPKKPNPLMDKQVGLPLQPLTLSSPYFPPQFQT